MKNKVSDIVADFLKFQKIEVVFGIIGSANSYLFDSIQNLGYTQIICLHHEQAVVMAMSAYYRASGKLSAALVTAGAGASNSITGILSAWADSIPGIIFSGQEPSRYLHNSDLRMYGTQGFKSSEMVKSITKYSEIVLDPSHVQNILEEAYEKSINNRPGPVWVEFPFDLQSPEVEFREWKKTNTEHEEFNYQNQIEFIVQEIKESQKPLIVLGNGIKLSKGEQELFDLLKILKIPVMTTWSAMDLINQNNDYYFGRFGLYGQRAANFIVQKCDLLLCLGSRMAIPQIGYNINEFAPNAKIIVIDIDENELKKYDRFIGINANVKTILSELSKILYDNSRYISWLTDCKRIAALNPLLLNEYYENDNLVNSYLFLNKFSQKLGKNDIVVTDMGTALLSGHQVMESHGYKMFTSQGLGEMGVGLPYAIGAAMSSIDSTIHCLNCDGGMMMNLQELQTIKHINKKIKIIIFNNDGYLMIKHTQKMLFDGRYAAVSPETGVSLPNFEKISEAFDYKYLRIDNMRNFDEIMDQYFKLDESLILEIYMDPEQEFIPKVKGVPVAQSNTIFSPPLEEMSPILPFEFVKDIMGSDISPKSSEIDR